MLIVGCYEDRVEDRIMSRGFTSEEGMTNKVLLGKAYYLRLFTRRVGGIWPLNKVAPMLEMTQSPEPRGDKTLAKVGYLGAVGCLTSCAMTKRLMSMQA